MRTATGTTAIHALQLVDGTGAAPIRDATLVITGNGDVLEPEDGVGAIGSGGSYAQAAAKALQENTELSPAEIVKKALTIAGELCIYTNLSLTIETLD